ncbi:MAG TPA: hypothetical protein VFZ58_01390 [Candidatus Saccharimonadales bacterium]
MEERGNVLPPNNHEHNEQKERIQRALLSPDDTWLKDILHEDFVVTEEWCDSINKLLGLADTVLKSTSTFSVSNKVKLARREIFSSLANNAKDDHIGFLIEGIADAEDHPVTFIINAKLFATHGINVARVLRDTKEVFRFKPETNASKIEANSKLFGEERVISYINRKPRTFLGSASDHNELKVDALSKVNNLLPHSFELSSAFDEAPELLANALAKNFAIARIALEFSDPNSDITLPQINTAFTRPVDDHMLAVIKNQNYKLGHAQKYREAIQSSERREQVLRQLSPAKCRMLGGNVLRAYFRAKPLSKEEQAAYPALAEHSVEHFRQYDQPFRDKDALLSTSDEPMLQNSMLPAGEITTEKLDHLNKLIRRGSKSAMPRRPMGKNNPVTRARHEFLEELGWKNEAHPMFRRLSNFLKHQPNAISPVTLVRALRFAHEHSVDYVQFLATFPSLAPADIESIERRKNSLSAIISIAGREADEAPLTNKFARYLSKSEAEWAELERVAAIYQQRSRHPFTDGNLRNLFATDINSHLEVLLDSTSDPKEAYAYMRRTPRKTKAD